METHASEVSLTKSVVISWPVSTWRGLWYCEMMPTVCQNKLGLLAWFSHPAGEKSHHRHRSPGKTRPWRILWLTGSCSAASHLCGLIVQTSYTFCKAQDRSKSAKLHETLKDQTLPFRVKAWTWPRTTLCRDKEKAGYKNSSPFPLIRACFLYLTISSRVMLADCLHFMTALGMLCTVQVTRVSRSTPPFAQWQDSDARLWSKNQRGVNVNRLSLFEELPGTQCSVNSCVRKYCGLTVLHAVDIKKSNFVHLNKINLFSF